MAHWTEASGEDLENLMAAETPAMALCKVPPSPRFALESQLGIPIKSGGVPLAWSAVPDGEGVVARKREEFGSGWSSHLTSVVNNDWMVMNTMFYAPSATGDLTHLTELVSNGDAFLVITPERLILSIVSGQSDLFGDLAAKHWALLVSWPLNEIHRLHIEFQKARFGGKSSVSEFIIEGEKGFQIVGRIHWSSVLTNLENGSDKGNDAFEFLSMLARAVNSARNENMDWAHGTDETDKRFTYSEISWVGAVNLDQKARAPVNRKLTADEAVALVRGEEMPSSPVNRKLTADEAIALIRRG